MLAFLYCLSAYFSRFLWLESSIVLAGIFHRSMCRIVCVSPYCSSDEICPEYFCHVFEFFLFASVSFFYPQFHPVPSLCRLVLHPPIFLAVSCLKFLVTLPVLPAVFTLSWPLLVSLPSLQKALFPLLTYILVVSLCLLCLAWFLLQVLHRV